MYLKIIRLIPLWAMAFSTLSCVITNILTYPNTEYYEQITDDPDAISICLGLEAKGYQFDDFAVDHLGVEVTYPNGRVERYSQSYSVSPVLITSINRDFNNPDLFSEDEMDRLTTEAKNFCQDYQTTASELAIDLPLSGVLFWDYIIGVRGGFWFSEDCSITGSYGWSAGSYASRYELDPSQICPSGHVQY